MEKPKLLFSNPGKIVYEADELPCVSDALIEALDWPAAVPGLGIMFRREADAEYEVLQRNVSRKYDVRIIYRAQTAGLNAPASAEGECGVELAAAPGRAELVELYVKTQEEFFYKPWAEYVPMAQLKGTRTFAEKNVLPEHAVCFEKNGKRVGLAALVKSKDWFGAPVDLLAWVWFDAGLSAGERAAAHQKLAAWLKKVLQETGV